MPTSTNTIKIRLSAAQTKLLTLSQNDGLIDDSPLSQQDVRQLWIDMTDLFGAVSHAIMEAESALDRPLSEAYEAFGQIKSMTADLRQFLEGRFLSENGESVPETDTSSHQKSTLVEGTENVFAVDFPKRRT